MGGEGEVSTKSFFFTKLLLITKVTTLDWTQDMPHNDKPRYILAKTTHATGIHAAVLASFSRAFHAYNSTLSQLCLEQAQLAWSFLQAHADPIPLGGFRNPPDRVTGEANDVFDMDERVWAAAELFRATNAASYGEYVLTNPPSSDSGAGLAHTAEARQSGQRLAKQYFTNGVNDLIAKTNSNLDLNGARLDVSSWIGWGVFTYGSIPALSLLRANHFTPNTDAVNAAYLNIDAQLGANPLSRSFITGLAPRPPRRPTCEVCSADSEAEPYPGIPVFGPFAHLSNGHVFYKRPSPDLARYVDHPQVIPESEYTIGTMAHTYAALALLAGRPRVLLPQQNTAAQLVGYTLHVVLAKHITVQLGAVPCREVLAVCSPWPTTNTQRTPEGQASATPAASISISTSAPPSTTSTHSPSHSSIPPASPPPSTTSTHSPSHSSTPSELPASSSPLPAATTTTTHSPAHSPTSSPVLAASASSSAVPAAGAKQAVPIGTHFPIGAGQQVRAAAIEKYNVVCSLDYDPASIDLSNFSSAIAYCAIPDAYGLWDFKLNGAGAVHNSHHIENSLLIACNLAWLLFAFY
eukprot:g36410.t1